MAELVQDGNVKKVEAHLNYENMYFTAINNKDNVHAIAALESNRRNCPHATAECLQTKFCPDCEDGWKNGNWVRMPKDALKDIPEAEVNRSKPKDTKEKTKTTSKKKGAKTNGKKQ